ncbi:unnamed protein product [Acanthoscelides obtectus]|uniref:PiggyBac transposable element-derived protein domain-containing protein n=1 Tax=Acanthoscelides obtectus TaxID=200917 RepID=A0A9P0P0E8_ACAOB|nr:unnamed protein product [Acanthoscelides obtectus]CAK1642229.1 hypothetical protein AOBTE_LOCUS12905 [Acanthoscelides obtectus]
MRSMKTTVILIQMPNSFTVIMRADRNKIWTQIVRDFLLKTMRHRSALLQETISMEKTVSNGPKYPKYSKNTRTLQHNIVIKCPGVKSINLHKTDPEEVWNLFFDDRQIQIILQYSNLRMAKLREKYKNKNSSDTLDLDIIELKAFIGLLMLTAIFKSNHEDIR